MTKKITKTTGKIFRLVAKWFRLLGLLALDYWRIKRLSAHSMLAEQNAAKFALTACPVCGSTDIKPFFTFPFGWPEGQGCSLLYFQPADVHYTEARRRQSRLDELMGFFVSPTWNYCTTCRNAYLNIRLTDEHLANYYANSFGKDREIHPNRARTKALQAEFLASHLDSGSSVLEIGPAEGFAAERLVGLGFEVYVNELGAGFLERLKQVEGIKIIEDTKALPSGRFDCVLMSLVLEHIPAPAELVSHLRSLLRDDGLLFIQVPDLSTQLCLCPKYLRRSPLNLINPYKLDRTGINYDFPPANRQYPWIDAIGGAHVVAFTPEGITYLLESAGFKVEQVIQPQAGEIVDDPSKYSWAIDERTGAMPNNMIVLARRTHRSTRGAD